MISSEVNSRPCDGSILSASTPKRLSPTFARGAANQQEELDVGLFDWGRKQQPPHTQESSGFPPPGSKLDTVPAMDDYHLGAVKYWLDDWFEAVQVGNNATMIRLLTTYGEALESNGLRATLSAVQQGIDGREPGQRPWRWLSLACAAARQPGRPRQPALTVKVFYFMLQFDSAIRKAIEADDPDTFIEIGIDPPSVHSKYLIASEATTAMLDVDPADLQLPIGTLAVERLMPAAMEMVEEAERGLAEDGGPDRKRFLVGPPVAGGVWADSMSGEFRYGRSLEYWRSQSQ